MSGRHDLKLEPELRGWQRRRPRRPAFSAAPRGDDGAGGRDPRRASQRGRRSRAANAAALAIRVFDRTMRAMPPAYSGAQVACKAGCTYCCHNVVMATAPEIFLAVSELERARMRASSPAWSAGAMRSPPRRHQAQPLPPAARQPVLRLHGTAQRVPQAQLVLRRGLHRRLRGQRRRHSDPSLRPGDLRVLRRGAAGGHAAVGRAARLGFRAVGGPARCPAGPAGRVEMAGRRARVRRRPEPIQAARHRRARRLPMGQICGP